MPEFAVLYDPQQQAWLRFQAPLEICVVHARSELIATLQHLEQRVETERLYAAGFISYEAAPAFDPACATRAPDSFPLAGFGLFRKPEPIALPARPPAQPPIDWRPSLDQAAFHQAVEVIRNAIARGETYQVNFTFAMQAAFRGTPWEFFLNLVHGQQAAGAGYLDAGRWAICSVSPELFFHRDGERVTMRPMKGTAARGLTQADDLAARDWLAESPKNRAENIMILDMVRNDLGRLAIPGTVAGDRVCQLEKYPTVWQMTSTATARCRASQTELVRTLFPCASITGAPKPRTMQLIAELEQAPRRIYTGAFGWLGPGRQAHFNVAIRTALIDRRRQTAEYGVGAGITWDSESREEYAECLVKADILTRQQPDFKLLETLRWTPWRGYFLLQEHLQRLKSSADYFDIPCDVEQVATYLHRLAAGFDPTPRRVRLLLGQNGQTGNSHQPLDVTRRQAPVRLALARRPIDSNDRFLYHKTTQRQLYETAKAEHPEADDVLLWNQRGELTEACIANLVVELDGRLVTPPVACGLLAGTFRSSLLHRGCLTEQAVTIDDLRRCRRLFLINGVRKWQPAILMATAEESGHV